MNRRIFPAIVFAMLGALLWPPQARAQLVHYVDNVETCNGLLPCYTAIMDAVNAAMPSDSIEVFPGVYHEAAVFDRTKNNIILRARIAALRRFFAATKPSLVMAFLSYASVFAGLRWARRGTPFVINQHKNGMLTPWGFNATHDIEPITVEEYTSSRFILNPLRIWDCDRPVQASGRDQALAFGLDIGGRIVRGGGISWGSGGGDTNSFNTVEANFVSGGSGIGIHSANGYEDYNIFRRNTSVENTPCDIFDTVNNGPHNVNTWKNNRFFIKCGDATD